MIKLWTDCDKTRHAGANGFTLRLHNPATRPYFTLIPPQHPMPIGFKPHEIRDRDFVRTRFSERTWRTITDDEMEIVYRLVAAIDYEGGEAWSN